jgi:hypothetical protein
MLELRFGFTGIINGFVTVGAPFLIPRSQLMVFITVGAPFSFPRAQLMVFITVGAPFSFPRAQLMIFVTVGAPFSFARAQLLFCVRVEFLLIIWKILEILGILVERRNFFGKFFWSDNWSYYCDFLIY